MLGILLLLPAAILVQLLRINVVEGDALRSLWSQQTLQYIEIPAERGTIYDQNGTQIASNSVAYQIAVDPHAPGARADHFQDILQILSKHTGRSVSYYQQRIRGARAGSRYIVLERSIPVAAREEIVQHPARGVILEEEYQRSYGFGSLASHILGYVNRELHGVNGLEAHYQNMLQGESGLQQVQRDRSNRIFSYVGAPRKQPIQGHSLHTTIHSFIQAIAEEELMEGIRQTRANRGTAIVMDPRTGAIRAMANLPDYDPNEPARFDPSQRRNPAISDMIEPGSTFKLVTAIAALEEGVVNFEEEFTTPEDGQVTIHGQAMRDHDPLGTVTFTEAIARSSNIAISEIAMRLDPETFYQYARNLGFGTPTSIDLPNEESGRLSKPYDWSQVTLPWMSIGYEVQATPIQILQAYAAFANGGVMMKPHLVERVTDEFGETIRLHRPSSVRRIASQKTIDRLLPVFEEVVSDSGTASWAQVPGLQIAGKTGTAQKFIDGRYRNRYRASFVGFFPSRNPQYAILVLLDEPKTSFYGGYTAGQIFREIATRIAGLDPAIHESTPPEDSPDLLAIAPGLVGLDRTTAEAFIDEMDLRVRWTGDGSRIESQRPAAGDTLKAGDRLELTLVPLDSESSDTDLVSIPDLRGMSMRSATHLLQTLGLGVQQIGSGTIHAQFPSAGEQMSTGRNVTLRGRIRSFGPRDLAMGGAQ